LLLYLYYKAASRKSQEKDHYPVYTDFRLSQDQKFPKTRSAQEPLGAWAIIMKKS